MTPASVRSKLEVELFGGPRILDRERPIALSPFQAALLTVVHGHEEQGLTRRELAWLLWEADDDARARQRIRQLLHTLGRRAGVAVIEADGDRLRRSEESIESDLARFRGHLENGGLRKAATMVHRGFASALPVVPSDAFDDWLTAKSAGLRRQLRDAAARGWDAGKEAGDWAAARDAAEALYTLDPGDEAAVQRVIEARAATTSPGAAEAAYATLVESLDGRPPSAETEALMARVRSLDPRVDNSPSESHHEAPLVGRQDAVRLAKAAIERVGGGSFEFVLIRGESGIGKTRVLEELHRDARLAGFRCFSARPVELERRIPLNPILDALHSPVVARHIRSLESPWRAVLSALFPSTVTGAPPPPVPRIQESSLSRRLLDSFSLLFEELAAEEPTLLFLDDLQWADATTIAVLQFVQRRWDGGPLGIVAAIRPELVSPDDDVSRYLGDAAGLPVTTVTLGELTTEEGGQLVEHLAPNAIDTETKRQICDLGGRTPFYLVELTRDYTAGRLALPAVPVEAIAVPISLQQLFEARVANLSADATRLIGILAVWARSMRLESLATISGLSLDACADCAEELVRWRIVRLDRDTVRIAHELFRSAAYRHLSEARRAVLHRALAEHLATAVDEPNPGELAIHYAKAGEVDPAARHGREAADQAFENGAMAEAAYFYRLVTENEEDPELRALATADLGRVLHMARDLAKANPLLEVAATRLRQVGNEGQALRMDILRIEGLADTAELPIRDLTERLAAIKDHAREAEDWEALALALDAELHLMHRAGDISAIRQLFHQMRDCAGRGSFEAACIANMGLAMNVLFGSASDAATAARKAVTLAHEHDAARPYLLDAQNRLIVVLLYLGMLHLPENAELIRSALAAALSTGDLRLRTTVQMNLGVSHLDAGELDKAEEAFRKCGVTAGTGDLGLVRLHHHYNIGEVALHRGEYQTAEKAFQDAYRLLDPTTPAYLRAAVPAGLGLCALETGRLGDARRLEAEAEDDFGTWYDPTLIAWFRSRLLQRRGLSEEAVRYLGERADAFRERLTPVWLKLRLLELRLAHRTGVGELSHRLKECEAVAESLGFKVRARQFREILEAT